MKVYEIDGENFSTLEGFYDEFGRVVIPGVGWGRNLDAFDDVLYWPEEGFVLRWKNHDLSRQRLGYPETVRQLERRLDRCHPTNRELVRRELQLAREGKGPTVFDWLVEILTEDSPTNGDGELAEKHVTLELA